jgi:hypothetical protein
MRLLVLDHFFDQDIAALRAALTVGEELRVIPYQALRSEALRILPADVATGLEAFAAPEHEQARRRYAAVLREMLEDEYTVWPFDAFVAPSDVFFYVRAAPEASHALGVPFLVAQKETTISPHTMREHSERVRRYAPPIADHMTVCSEHHRDFWLRAGGRPDAITVTGQPRFDYFAHAADHPDDVGRGGGGPAALFLSYFVDAYHPKEGAGEPAWARMHRETEEALITLVAEGWRVLVKPHPQQPDVAELRARLRGAAGAAWEERVFLVDPAADVRPLIAAADVTVGFQSTAMLEGMLAGRPVVYTAWDEEAARLAGELIPFGEWEDVIDVVRDRARLAEVVRSRRGWRCNAATLARRCLIAEHYLGPLDGAAARRTLDVMSHEVQRFASARAPETERRRAALAARRRPLRPGRRVRAARRDLRRRVGALLGR